MLQFIKWFITTTLSFILYGVLLVLFVGFMLFSLEWVVTNMDALEKIIQNPETFNYWAVAKYIGFLLAGVWLLVILLADTDSIAKPTPVKIR